MKAGKRKKPAQYADDIAIEESFFKGIVRRDPSYVEALQLLGECYAKQGNWSQAVKVDERLVRLCPDAPMVHYNLACSYSLLNRLPQSLVALKKAIDLGFDDFAWLSRDPDLANLRSWLERDAVEKVKSGAHKIIPPE